MQGMAVAKCELPWLVPARSPTGASVEKWRLHLIKVCQLDMQHHMCKKLDSIAIKQGKAGHQLLNCSAKAQTFQS